MPTPEFNTTAGPVWLTIGFIVVAGLSGAFWGYPMAIVCGIAYFFLCAVIRMIYKSSK